MFQIAAAVSFLLFLVGDLNDAFWHRRFLKPAFFTGAALLTAATLAAVVKAPPAFRPGRIPFLAGAVLFGVLLVWALFFSFPPKQAYMEQSRERRVYDGGMYALCRHPGILWLCLLYGCLIPGAGFPPFSAFFCCLLDLLLGWAEDRWIFPRLFTDYDDYKQRVPFLIPTAASLRDWIHPRGKKP